VTATEPPGTKSAVSVEMLSPAQVTWSDPRAVVAASWAIAVAVAGLRAIDAARAAWAAAPSTSMRAETTRPKATTNSSINRSNGVSSTSSKATAPDSSARSPCQSRRAVTAPGPGR